MSLEIVVLNTSFTLFEQLLEANVDIDLAWHTRGPALCLTAEHGLSG
jgi:hypothetical protein